LINNQNKIGELLVEIIFEEPKNQQPENLLGKKLNFTIKINNLDMTFESNY